MSLPPSRFPEPLARWARIIWWMVALGAGIVLVADLLRLAEDGRFWRTLFYRHGEAYFWWLWLPVMVVLKRWLEAERPWWIWLSVHASALVAAVFLAEAVNVVLMLRANQLPVTFLREVWSDAIDQDTILQRVWTYAAIVVPLHAIGFYLSWRAEQRESAELKLAHAQIETRLVRANLDALKMQLHPHFLFNALNSIAALSRRGLSEQAEEATAKLGALLRRALDHRQDQLVPLAVEIEFLEHYFEIERIRFQDRLLVEIAVTRVCEAALVPSLLLQPLVENAMKHGFARLPEARRLRLTARREDGRLELALYNDSPPLPPGFTGEGQGIGLRNVRARLAMLYGERASLRLTDVPGGVVAELSLPFKETSP